MITGCSFIVRSTHFVSGMTILPAFIVRLSGVKMGSDFAGGASKMYQGAPGQPPDQPTG
jgi:hypothetical protein